MSQKPKMTAPKVRAMKAQGARIVVLTAYDVWSAELAEDAGVDIVLVGDSAGNVVHGFGDTIPVTLDHMLTHTAAVRRGLQTPLLVADLPFGSFQVSTASAVEASVALMRVGAEAVKLEGPYYEEIRAITKAGIPVMGHLGFTPQSVNVFGGHKVQGKGDDANRLVDEARGLEEAGAFALVLELIPACAAEQITSAVTIPTIGIGAGPACDGQVQVFHDVLGISSFHFKHAKRYVEGRQLFVEGLRQYVEETRTGQFPTSEHSQ